MKDSLSAGQDRGSGSSVNAGFTDIEQYPDMAPLQITIDARYPGATAEVIANNVAAHIEAQLNGLDNLLYFYSTRSFSGNVQIVVAFNQGSNPDIDIYQVTVQNRLSQGNVPAAAGVSRSGESR